MPSYVAGFAAYIALCVTAARVTTEQWALVVAVIALVVSVAVPVLQSRSTTAQAVASRRSLLLQKILAAKSITYVSMHDLIELLNHHGEKMDEEQRQNLAQMVPRMRTYHDDFHKLHEMWANFDDGESLKAVETALADVEVAFSEAEDTARLIERGRASYEDT